MPDHKDQLLRAVARAREQANAGRLEDAFQTLEGLGASAEDAPEVVYFQVLLLMSSRRWAEALQRLEALLRVLPGRAELHLDRATSLMELGRLEEARGALERDDTPVQGLAPRHLLLARIAVRERDLARAADELQKARQLDHQAISLALETPELAWLIHHKGLLKRRQAHVVLPN